MESHCCESSLRRLGNQGRAAYWDAPPTLVASRLGKQGGRSPEASPGPRSTEVLMLATDALLSRCSKSTLGSIGKGPTPPAGAPATELGPGVQKVPGGGQ